MGDWWMFVVGVGVLLWDVIFVVALSQVGVRSRRELIWSSLSATNGLAIATLFIVGGVLGGDYVNLLWLIAFAVAGCYALARFIGRRMRVI